MHYVSNLLFFQMIGDILQWSEDYLKVSKFKRESLMYLIYLMVKVPRFSMLRFSSTFHINSVSEVRSVVKHSMSRIKSEFVITTHE